MRQVFLLFVLLVVAQWCARVLRRARQQNRQASGGARKTARAEALPEPMVRCATCGVHVPKSEAITAVGQSFCCGEHARQYAARASASSSATNHGD